MDLNNRLRLIRSELRLSQNDVSKTIGVHQNTLSQYENTDRSVPNDVLEKFVEKYKINAEWLLTGRGNMKSASIPTEAGRNITQADPDNKDVAMIEMLDVEASAGNGIVNYCENVIDKIPIPLEMIHPHQPANVRMIKVVGDSMQDNGGGFLHGDWIFHLIDGQTHGDGPYVVCMDSHIFVKQLQFRPTGILILSINKNYPPIEVDKGNIDGFRVIGRVIAKFRRYG